MTIHQRSGGPAIPMELWVMAAKEDLYAKVTPRRQRQSRPSTIKHGSTLDVLLSMGFPKTRAWVHSCTVPRKRHKHTRTRTRAILTRLNQASQQHPSPAKVACLLILSPCVSITIRWCEARGDMSVVLCMLWTHGTAHGAMSDDPL